MSQNRPNTAPTSVEGEDEGRQQQKEQDQSTHPPCWTAQHQPTLAPKPALLSSSDYTPASHHRPAVASPKMSRGHQYSVEQQRFLFFYFVVLEIWGRDLTEFFNLQFALDISEVALVGKARRLRAARPIEVVAEPFDEEWAVGRRGEAARNRREGGTDLQPSDEQYESQEEERASSPVSQSNSTGETRS